jgi:tetratricopeptide (TPR) repeat protein
MWAVLLLRGIATFWPSSWLWGLDSLTDLSPAVRVAGLLLFGLALTPAAGRATVAALSRVGRVPLPIAVVGLSLALCAGLTGLDVGHTLLGDTQTYVSSLERGVRAAGGAHREPLPQAIVLAVYEGIVRPLDRPPRDAFTAVEIVLTTGLVLLALLLARRSAASVEGRAAVVSTILFGGGLLLFAGYAEFYPFSVVASLLFAWVGLRWIDERRALWLASLSYLLAALCHAQAIFALPALLLLFLLAWKQGSRREVGMHAVLLPLVALGALALLRYPFGELGSEATRAGAFLPPFSERIARTAYSAVSLPHAAELINVALLICPVLPALAVLRPAPGAVSATRQLFLGGLALGPFVFAGIANPQLGMVRDWDLFVAPVVLVALLAAARAGAWFDRARAGGRALAGCLLLTACAHAFFWLVANHENHAARERVRRVAANSLFFGPQSHGEIWRFLGGADLRALDERTAAESYLRSIRAYPDERMTYRLLASLRIAEAIRTGRGVESGLSRYHAEVGPVSSRSAFPYFGGCFAAAAVQRDDLALEQARKMAELDPDYPELQASYGDFLRRAGQLDQARERYDRALARDPNNPRARIGLACLAGVQGDRATLEAQIRETLRRTPWSPQAQQFANLLSRGELTEGRCLRTLYIR